MRMAATFSALPGSRFWENGGFDNTLGQSHNPRTGGNRSSSHEAVHAGIPTCLCNTIHVFTHMPVCNYTYVVTTELHILNDAEAPLVLLYITVAQHYVLLP